MKNQINVVSWLPLSQKIYDELCLNVYSNIYPIEYLDLSELFYPNVRVNNTKHYADISIVKINSYKEVYKYLKNHRISYILMHIPLTSHTLILYIILKRFKIKIISYEIGYTPNSHNFTIYRNKSFSYKIKLFKSFIKSIILRLLKLFNVISEPRYILCAGYKARIIHSKNGLIFNSDDYEKYRSIKKNKTSLKTKYCVFLDSYLPWHPDFISLGFKRVDEKKYLYEINRFFDQIELTGVKVIIAAHPKSKYENNEYKNRDVIYNKTAELVSDANFVISHTSTSINFAVLYDKAIILIYTDEYYHIYKNDYFLFMDIISKELDCKMMNISSEFFININPRINIRAYKDYVYNYISEDTSGLTNDEIIRKILS